MWWIIQIISGSSHIMKTHLCQIYRKFTSKNWKLSHKKLWHFSYFWSKHRLWYSLEPPRQGGSNEYPQSMFLSRNKKNNVYPCKPQFYYMKVGFKGVKIIWACFRDDITKNTPIFSLEPPRRDGSNEYPQSMFRAEIWKISDFFIRKFFFFSCKIINIFEKACFRNEIQSRPE